MEPVDFTNFPRIVREERLFCAVFAHLLLQRGRDLEAFVRLISKKSAATLEPGQEALAQAQIYVEFTFLRDSWESLGHDNARKRDLVIDLLGRIEGLRRFSDETLPSDPSAFNELFAGAWGKRIVRDIVYPGRWTVASLGERFGGQPQEFRDLCRFKWSFNIKPDVVVLIPGMRPLCVEAKVASGEGQYPSSYGDRKVFDGIFGQEKGRVNQVELQQFMFETLLGTPAELITLGLTSKHFDGAVAMTWQEAFGAMELKDSVEFVQDLVERNVHIS